MVCFTNYKEKNNEYNLIGYNCSNFATKIWNVAAGIEWKFWPIVRPASVCSYIRKIDTIKYEVIENPKLEFVDYYKNIIQNIMNLLL